MLNTIKNSLKNPEIRRRILFTLLLILVFRLGCFIIVPGVNSVVLKEELANATGTLTGLINTISGGAFSKLSIFAMSVTPYITASIILQLLAMIIPSLEKLVKDGGEEGRQRMNKYTKILTIVLATVEALGIYLSYSKSYGEVFINPGLRTGTIFVLSLVTGTSILMWLGDQITGKGIGNGISMLIFVGIISGLPDGALTLYNLAFNPFSTTNFLITLAILFGAILLIAGVVFVQEAERRVPVQYAKKVVGSKTCYGRCNANNFCFIIYDITSNAYTNLFSIINWRKRIFIRTLSIFNCYFNIKWCRSWLFNS